MTTIARWAVRAPVLAVLSLSSPALADGVPITPGLWEIKTENSLLGTAEVEQQCMQEAVFDPADVLGEEDGCEIDNETVDGNTVDYDLLCVDPEARGSAKGHFTFTVDGDEGSGNVDITFDIGGETVDMRYSLAAARVGDC